MTTYEEKKPLKQLPAITPKELKEMLNVLDELKNPPALMVYGVPGIGKTTIIKDFANEKNFELRVKHLSRMDTTDWSGIPKQSNDSKYTEFLPIYLFKPPAEEGKKIIIFFDELNTATPQVLNAALDVILEKKGDYGAELPANTIIVAAGNLGEEDGTYVESLSSAVKTRLIQVRLEQKDVNDWLDWAGKNSIHKKVTDFIRENGINYLIDLTGFQNNDDQIATPRGWERVSDFLKIYESNNGFPENEELKKNILKHFIIGTLGNRVGEKFYNTYISIKDSLKEWESKINEYSIIYKGNVADQTPENICEMLKYVNSGLSNNYSDATQEAQRFTKYLVAKLNSLDRNTFSNLSGKNIDSFLGYLENYKQGKSEQDIQNNINKIISLLQGGVTQ
ncbi:MAG: MoxR family ATPase [Endomicrobiia bacterium]